MGRPTSKLTDTEAKKAKAGTARTPPGEAAQPTAKQYPDGGGLFLNVTANGSKSWLFVYRSPTRRKERQGKQVGRTRKMGLGGYPAVSLKNARDRARALREILADGVDPLDVTPTVPVLPKAMPTFGAVADQVIAAHRTGWKNDKHKAQWVMTLKVYAAALRPLPVDQVTTENVLEVLKPLWTEKAETASRLRGRIEKVLDAAKAMGHRVGENPARWRGHLDHLLPARGKLQRGHHAALAFDRVPAFITQLRGMQSVGARCLEFTILTAARSGEARGAQWSEIDLAAKVWTIPARRMKAGNEHRVPLVERAVEILREIEPLGRECGNVFPGIKSGRPISEMTMESLLRRAKLKPAAVHGFRSCFKDWAAETTNFPNELSEAALAHITGDKDERAYRRGDALERRRELMTAWACYCGSA